MLRSAKAPPTNHYMLAAPAIKIPEAWGTLGIDCGIHHLKGWYPWAVSSEMLVRCIMKEAVIGCQVISVLIICGEEGGRG